MKQDVCRVGAIVRLPGHRFTDQSVDYNYADPVLLETQSLLLLHTACCPGARVDEAATDRLGASMNRCQILSFTRKSEYSRRVGCRAKEWGCCRRRRCGGHRKRFLFLTYTCKPAGLDDQRWFLSQAGARMRGMLVYHVIGVLFLQEGATCLVVMGGKRWIGRLAQPTTSFTVSLCFLGALVGSFVGAQILATPSCAVAVGLRRQSTRIGLLGDRRASSLCSTHETNSRDAHPT